MRDTIHRRAGGRRPERLVTLAEGRLARLISPLIVGEAVLVLVLGALVWHANHADTLDGRVARALYAQPGSTLRSAFAVLTIFGATGVAAAASLLIGGWTAWRFRDRLLAIFCPASVLIAVVVESVLKKVVSRTRPATAVLAHVGGRSFPSGHATAASALGFSAALLVVATGVAWRRAAVVVLLAYAVTISLSRLVLGVHYLTDVVAGTALAGIIVLAMAWLCSRAAEPSP